MFFCMRNINTGFNSIVTAKASEISTFNFYLIVLCRGLNNFLTQDELPGPRQVLARPNWVPDGGALRSKSIVWKKF